MQLIMIDGCPLCGKQARSWENEFGTWAACPDPVCPMVGAPVRVWNALSATRNDLLATQRAITAIRHEERERCARIAESFIPSGFTGTHPVVRDALAIARDDRARTIAQAIRERT